MIDTLNISELKEILADFAKIREWERFHSPKIYLWLNPLIELFAYKLFDRFNIFFCKSFPQN